MNKLNYIKLVVISIFLISLLPILIMSLHLIMNEVIKNVSSYDYILNNKSGYGFTEIFGFTISLSLIYDLVLLLIIIDCIFITTILIKILIIYTEIKRVYVYE